MDPENLLEKVVECITERMEHSSQSTVIDCTKLLIFELWEDSADQPGNLLLLEIHIFALYIITLLLFSLCKLCHSTNFGDELIKDLCAHYTDTLTSTNIDEDLAITEWGMLKQLVSQR